MKILILASNPHRDLNLDDELRIVQGELDRTAKREQFPVVKEVGVRVGDLQRLVLQHRPEIIHFCGHGSGEEGLIFKVDGGGEQRVRADALATLFGLCDFVKCVLLNACYSEEQAMAIAQHTEYVIGMSNTIQDNAAIAFSKGFYTALGNDCPIELSFAFGKNAIQLEVSGSSIKRSSATAIEERKAEVVDVVNRTELKEHEKPRIFINGKEQLASDLDPRRANQSISEAKREEVLLKIDESLGDATAEARASSEEEENRPARLVEESENLKQYRLRQATLTDVLALRYDALSAESRDPIMAKQLWIRVLMVSPGDPEAIAGIERLSRGNSAPLSEAPDPTPPSAPVTTPSPADTTGSRRVDVPVAKPEPVPQSPPLVPPTYRVERLAQPAQPPNPVNVPTPSPQKSPTFEFEVIQVDADGNITQREQRKTEYRREHIGNVTLDLVLIPRGRFQMGSASDQGKTAERPQHEVSVKPFLMGKYPVTQDQWRAVSTFPKVGRDLPSAPSSFKGGNRPVESVNWDDAEEFCKRLSNHTKREYRLPSEAEWEYACRAGTTTAFYFGEKLTSKLAQCISNVGMALLTMFSGHAPVGSFFANAFGLYDMHGNVWEWCQDHWHENYAGAPTDGSAWITGGDASRRLLRGGSWSNNPGDCRSANRDWLARDDRNDFFGFRVVCVSS